MFKRLAGTSTKLILLLAGLALTQPAAAQVFYSNYTPTGGAGTQVEYWLPLKYRTPDASQTFDAAASVGVYTTANSVLTTFVAPNSFTAASIIMPVRQTLSFGNFRIGVGVSWLDTSTGDWVGLGSTQIESGLLGWSPTLEVQLPFGVSGARYIDYNYQPINFVAGETYQITAMWGAGAAGFFNWYLSDDPAASGQSTQIVGPTARSLAGPQYALSFEPAFALAGLGEPKIVSNVPEASTWAMMIAGFGAVGFSVRRRNRRLGAQALA